MKKLLLLLSIFILAIGCKKHDPDYSWVDGVYQFDTPIEGYAETLVVDLENLTIQWGDFHMLIGRIENHSDVMTSLTGIGHNNDVRGTFIRFYKNDHADILMFEYWVGNTLIKVADWDNPPSIRKISD